MNMVKMNVARILACLVSSNFRALFSAPNGTLVCAATLTCTPIFKDPVALSIHLAHSLSPRSVCLFTMLAFITRKLSQVTATLGDSQTDAPTQGEDGIPDTNHIATTSPTGTTSIAQAQVTDKLVVSANSEDVGAAAIVVDQESSPAQESAIATKAGATPAQAPQEILQPLRPTPHSISTRIKKVPAKTLHDFALSQVATADESTLKALASFFEDLKPPPRLHCVRCHKDFTEVENDARSCLVPHDDESAEVERVGRTADLWTTADTPASSYQTLWGCCGKVTDGDGSHGPPDGWCYEGKHTVRLWKFISQHAFHECRVLTYRSISNVRGFAKIRHLRTTSLSRAFVSTVTTFATRCRAGARDSAPVPVSKR